MSQDCDGGGSRFQSCDFFRYARLFVSCSGKEHAKVPGEIPQCKLFVIPSQSSVNYGMIATGNHTIVDSLRGAPLV